MTTLKTGSGSGCKHDDEKCYPFANVTMVANDLFTVKDTFDCICTKYV